MVVLKRKKRSFLDRVARMSKVDYTGPEWHGCICGSEWIVTPVSFDEGGVINSYGTTGFCAHCGAQISVPCPKEGNYV